MSIRQVILFGILLIVVLFVECSKADMSRIEAAAVSAGNGFDIDPDLVLAVIEVESRFNPAAVGTSHGEVGLMQLHPRYFPDASFDIARNVFEGVAYLAYVRSVCRGECDALSWVALYNTGPSGKADKQNGYYRKVMRAYLARKGGA